MPRHRKTVTWTKRDLTCLPDWSSEAVALIADLERRGMLEQLESRLQIRREGGFVGIDVLLHLLVFFCSRCGVGIKTFWAQLSPYNQQLAALAGRKKLPSPASMSRALEAVSDLRPLYRWLLLDVAGADEVLRHPTVVTRDARGEPWHVFDYDGTRHVLRHRALPEGDDLPVGERRSKGIAAAGYTGRKRGDAQIHRGTLQHSGSGLWLDATMSPGNGHHRRDLDTALATVVATCKRLSHPLDRSLLRMDGAYGWVPDFTACREYGVPFVTRLNRPDLLEQPDIRRRLLEGSWVTVPDSGGGPRRSAVDLGLVTILPDEETRRDDDTPYAPITVRVVVSRFEREKAQRGRVIEGWQYELFALDAAPGAWSAAEGVAAYFGRTAQENRFAQEDKELVLDRIFSYTPAGQELATILGLMVWNLRIARGFEIDPPPAELPAQQPAATRLDERPVPAATVRADPPVPEPVLIGSAAPEPVPVPVPVLAPEEAQARLREALDQLDWPALLASRPGWRWRVGRAEVQCPDDQVLRVSSIDRPPRTRLLFTSVRGVCHGCQLRNSCFPGARPRVPKLVSFTVSSEEAASLRPLLSLPRRTTPDARPASPQAPRPNRRGDLPVQPPSTEPPGPYAVAVSLFLPAAARRTFAREATLLTTRVKVDIPKVLRQPALTAATPEDRQHRRLTWTARVQRNALPNDAHVHVSYAGAGRLAMLLDSETLQDSHAA